MMHTASAYHAATQSNGRGRMILRLTGGNQAVVVAVDLTDEECDRRLAELRLQERP